MRQGSIPWIVLDDFNVMSGDGERIGGRSRPIIALKEFNDFIDVVGLVDLKFEGNSMSWCNDRHGSARSWNGPSEDTKLDLVATKVELATWVSREETRLAQQAKQAWIEQGEANASFFCAVSSRSNKVVREMKLSYGVWLQSPKEVHLGAVEFLKKFSASSHLGSLPDLSSLVDKVVGDSGNSQFLEFPSIQEVKDAVLSISINSSPSPDGFGSGFYKSCWDIVGGEVVEAVHDLFRGSPSPRFFSSSFLVLIPKVKNPQGFEKFRPSSLCSIFYKIYSKILVGRLSPFLPIIISQEQGVFIRWRSIFGNISMTQELIQSINKPSRGGNVVLKIDMAKEYDSVDWNFLIHVLSGFGFSKPVCCMFCQCISSPCFYVVMNGVPKGFFQAERRLRQGDPIFPYLLIVVEVILSRLLRQNFLDGSIGAYYCPRGTLLISLLLYIDDIVIFANGSKPSSKALSITLGKYEEWSGQRVS
ncbi:uncharacterized protein LOC121244256 [Juglans microcarpa x Juglans regia]|uniref:uncharacterized protein LOC121244256 n=1 Tax=Juglans microcarpa x Juglans regia TaxID=2249226 RepID=UPI001B7EA065|nr:uncharacterized protein LOC121244256 [Juglans microcarpa x Juglans regia]